MSKHVDKHVKNPMAHLLNQGQFKPKKVKPKKGRGSYSRKGAKYYTKGGPLSGLLSLGDDATDLARKNLERIKSQPVTRTSRLPASSDKWEAPKRNVWGADSVSPEKVKKIADVASDFIPGVGEAKDIARAGSNIAAGNYGAAALDAATAAIGVVPGVGDAAAAGIRGARKAAAPLRNFHGFERAQQRLADLVPDQKTWNTINTKAQQGDIEVGDITRRDREGKGGTKDTIKGQEARNAAVTIDGKKVPVVVVPHKNPKFKWHIITTRDRGRNNDITDTLGGREYAKGGMVGGK